MARAIWSGSISFGLVNVPVKVFTALREHSIHFHQVEKGTGSRIRYEKVSERTGEQVASDDIELGYELAKGQLVTVDPAQLGELRPRTTRTIDITDFVDLADIDPVYYDRTYWLAPDGEGAQRPYTLLLHAMQDRQQVGIGTVVVRNKQYLAAIRPRDGALAMSTMHFADEVLDQPDVGRGGSPAAKELDLATQIIDTLSSSWDPARYRDTYTDEVKDLIERQAHGEHIVAEESEATGEVVDLMAALEASLRAADQKGKPAAQKASGQSGSAESRRGRTASGSARSGRTASAKARGGRTGSGKARGGKTASGNGRTTLPAKAHAPGPASASASASQASSGQGRAGSRSAAAKPRARKSA
jgi:DNA end-binding protein Ku